MHYSIFSKPYKFVKTSGKVKEGFFYVSTYKYMPSTPHHWVDKWFRLVGACNTTPINGLWLNALGFIKCYKRISWRNDAGKEWSWEQEESKQGLKFPNTKIVKQVRYFAKLHPALISFLCCSTNKKKNKTSSLLLLSGCLKML